MKLNSLDVEHHYYGTVQIYVFLVTQHNIILKDAKSLLVGSELNMPKHKI